ncbi:transmembrane protein 161A isoform X1 [Chelonia mydas]|uniref:transmembrane protein 161A isoform X1 n=1 Tax=Chelonia mydas TaxID=8469 RepID=UPI0018A1FE3D|nr:transmembrane protein 161A isoform X1 [Chelonia mydas]
MAVLGVQLAVSLLTASIMQRMSPHCSFARWLLCNGSLYRYKHPSEEELYALAGKQKPKAKRDRRLNGVTEDKPLSVPKDINLHLETAPITTVDALVLRYFLEYQWFVDFAVYSTLVYLFTEGYYCLVDPRKEMNIGILWCLLTVFFSVYPSFPTLPPPPWGLATGFPNHVPGSGGRGTVGAGRQESDPDGEGYREYDGEAGRSNGYKRHLVQFLAWLKAPCVTSDKALGLREARLPSCKKGEASPCLVGAAESRNDSHVLRSCSDEGCVQSDASPPLWPGPGLRHPVDRPCAASRSGRLTRGQLFPAEHVARGLANVNDNLEIFLKQRGWEWTVPITKLTFKLGLVALCSFIGACLTFPGLRLAQTHLDALKMAADRPMTQILLHASFLAPLVMVVMWIKPISRDLLLHAPMGKQTVQIMSDAAYNSTRLWTVVALCLLRLAMTRHHLQAYLQLAERWVEQMKREAGRITALEIQRRVTRIYCYVTVVSLQYLGPIILTLHCTLLLKSLGDYSWGLFPEPPPVSPVVGIAPAQPAAPSAEEEGGEDMQATVAQITGVLGAILTPLFYRGLFAFLTWWVALCQVITSLFGLYFHQYLAAS